MSAEGVARGAEEARARAQRRAIWVLSASTVLGGLGVGASVSAGALLIMEVTGNAAISGFGSTLNAVGAAAAGIPLARLAAGRGRRVALATGNALAAFGALTVIVAAGFGVAAAMFVGLGLLGIASAVQLQARFAATDLALPGQRARDLSLVVWSITIGAVSGPNLIAPGEVLGGWFGVPGLAGVFIFSLLAQLAALATVWFGLRPDPLIESRRLTALVAAPIGAPSGVGLPATELEVGSRGRQWLVIMLIGIANAVMIGIMAMTPLHLTDHGGSVTVVGFTISIHIAGMFALSPLWGMLAGRIGMVQVILLGFIVLGLAAACTGIGGHSVLIVQIGLVLLGLGWGMVTVVGAALLTTLTPAEIRPRRQGQSDTVMNASGAAFGAASGVIFAVGGFTLLSGIAGGLLMVAIVATIWLIRASRSTVELSVRSGS